MAVAYAVALDALEGAVSGTGKPPDDETRASMGKLCKAVGDFSAVKEAMEQSMAEGSQTFEEDIARLIIEERVTREEGLAQSDSPTNLMWRLQNRAAPKQKAEERNLMDQVDEPTFTDITLDVKF